MISGNISMDEDTELRELVVQTLENNGVLAKVRAELRASVFLTLEEQESVLNPKPFLNKSVKQCLDSLEGKLLFSLVREFLEYFGLDYTISVYDPETYLGKEYNYIGRKKLCEVLGIDSKQSLLGELLKNTVSSALNNSQSIADELCNVESYKPNKSTKNLANTTFDVSIPTIFQKDSISDCNDVSEKLESVSTSNLEMPINVTITKKQADDLLHNKITNSPVFETLKSSSDESHKNPQHHEEKNFSENISSLSHIATDETNVIANHTKVITDQLDIHSNEDTCKINKTNLIEFQTANNLKNKKQVETLNSIGETLYFDKIIVDGVAKSVSNTQSENVLLGELPPLPTANNSIFSDLPPLNGKKANINDLKELMDIAQGVSQYEEDSPSSTWLSTSELSPQKIQFKSRSPETYINTEHGKQNIQSENESEEIDEEIPSNNSCAENSTEKNIENLTLSATSKNYMG